MDRQLIASTAKTSSNHEQNSSSQFFSSSSFLNQNRNNRNNNLISNNNQNNFRNQNQVRRNNQSNQRPNQNKQASSNYTTSTSTRNNGGRNNLSQRFNGQRKLAASINFSKVSAKERFVQANCQFVMKSTILQDYCSHLKDPDLPIDWENVEEVIFKNSGNDQVCCPICLSDPVAAKITRCGHIYCWSCVLHYLALSDDNYRPCPICYERIRKNELKSATILQKVSFKKLDFITFQLMKINKGSTVAFPANYDVPEDVSMGRLKRNVDETLNQICKYFVSSPNYLEELIIREEMELFKQKCEYQAEEMPEVCFVEEALTALDDRKGDLLNLEELSNELSIMFETEKRLSGKNVPINEWIYFYLSDDGQTIFLHPLNVRMLKHEFGELKNCPLNFSAKIIEILGESANEEIRRRNAHFRHLPLSCELKIAEVELNNQIVSQATLDHFAGEIHQRSQDRRRKEKKQQKRDRKIDIENRHKIFGVPTHGPSFNFNDASEFPVWNDFGSSPESASGLSYPQLSPSSNPEPSLEPSTSSIPSAVPTSSNRAKEFQSSFASLLHGNNNKFQSATTCSGTNSRKAVSESRVLEGANHTFTSMDMSMSDFLENCIKRSKQKKNKKGKKVLE